MQIVLCTAVLVAPLLLLRLSRTSAPTALRSGAGTAVVDAARTGSPRASRGLAAPRLEAAASDAAVPVETMPIEDLDAPSTAAPTSVSAPTSTSTTAASGPRRATTKAASATTSQATVATTTTTAPRPTTTTTAAPRPTTTTTTATPAPANAQSGQASWYDDSAGSCAHRTIAIGTVVTVTNTANSRSTRCTVTNRGPYSGGRIIDLAKATFANIADPAAGVIDVRITW